MEFGICSVEDKGWSPERCPGSVPKLTCRRRFNQEKMREKTYAENQTRVHCARANTNCFALQNKVSDADSRADSHWMNTLDKTLAFRKSNVSHGRVSGSGLSLLLFYHSPPRSNSPRTGNRRYSVSCSYVVSVHDFF